MPKIPINSRVDVDTLREIDELYNKGNSAFKNKSELVRECITEGVNIVKKRINNIKKRVNDGDSKK